MTTNDIATLSLMRDSDVCINQSDEHVSREPRYDPHLVTEQKYLGDMHH
jgi:hypothetical protein